MTAPLHIAVLTGDLIDSTSLGPERIAHAFTALEGCAAMLAEWTGAPLHFTRHRGDGWQVVLARPEMALRSALVFRATLKAEDAALDSAIGIAEGFVVGPVGPDLNKETAEPFVVSGRALEIARRSTPNLNHAKGGATEATAIYADRVCRQWTRAQAAAMRHALHPLDDPDYSEIGRTLGISRQAVAKALRSAWCDESRLALRMLESDCK